MILRQFFIISSLHLLLLGCSSITTTDVSSPLYTLPEGSTLELHQAISFPPHLARVFMQNGKLSAEKSIDKYHPYCEFEITTLSNDIQLIKPDQFEIYKAIDNEHEVNRYFMFASLFMSSVDGPIILGYASEFYLRSQKQPQVRLMTCLRWDDPGPRRYLSLTDIRQALGNIFSIYPGQ